MSFVYKTSEHILIFVDYLLNGKKAIMVERDWLKERATIILNLVLKRIELLNHLLTYLLT